MRKETTCSREACWYHSLTAKRTGISSCISAPTTKVALELCLWRTMPLSWLAPKATIIPAESQSLPSDVHSYLHGLSVDKNQLSGGHLAPQALSRSVPSVTFKPLMLIPVYKLSVALGWEWKVLAKLLGHSMRGTTETSRRNSFVERVWEKRFLCPT